MFRGINDLNLDAKGRISVPSRYREHIQQVCEGSLIVTVGVDYCLLLYPFPEWEKIEHKLMQLPNLDEQVRDLNRLLLGHATECEMDGQHRVLLPPPLRNFAGLDKHAVLFGQGNKRELWDRDTWEKKRERMIKKSSKAGDVSSVLGTLSI